MQSNKVWLSPVLMALLCLGFVGHSRAEPAPAPVWLAADFVRLGEARKTHWGLPIYDAVLFGTDAKSPPGARFALQLTYKLGLKGHRIAERSLQEMRGLGLKEGPQAEQWLAEMRRLFPDVKDGQRLVGVVDGAGVSHFYFDQTYLGRVDDPEFGRWFFAIWLDPKTSEPAMRRALLGQAQ